MLLLLHFLTKPNDPTPLTDSAFVFSRVGDGIYQYVYNGSTEIGSYDFTIFAMDSTNGFNGSEFINSKYQIRSEHSVFVAETEIPQIISGRGDIEEALALNPELYWISIYQTNKEIKLIMLLLRLKQP